MKVSILQMFLMFWITIFSLNAQTNERYIEVTGTSEVEIIPDKIHYIIEIQDDNGNTTTRTSNTNSIDLSDYINDFSFKVKIKINAQRS